MNFNDLNAYLNLFIHFYEFLKLVHLNKLMYIKNINKFFNKLNIKFTHKHLIHFANYIYLCFHESFSLQMS